MCGGDVQNKNGWRKQVNITFRLPLLDREIKILISRITALAFSQGSSFVDYDIRLFEELESLVTANVLHPANQRIVFDYISSYSDMAETLQFE